MASNDSEPRIDFSLVSTYIPGLLLLLRSMLFLVLFQVMVLFASQPNSGIHTNIILYCMAVLIYFDAWWHRHDALNRACGFLAPVFLCVATTSDDLHHHPNSCSSVTATVLYYTLGVTWAASSGFCIIGAMLRLGINVNIYMASVCWAVVLFVLLYIDCAQYKVHEMIARVLAFYMLAILAWFSQVFQQDIERSRFSFSVLHVHLHVLFVDRYIILGSIVVWCCAFAFQRQNTLRARPNTHSTSNKKALETGIKHEMKQVVDDSVLQQLHAAKRAGGLV